MINRMNNGKRRGTRGPYPKEKWGGWNNNETHGLKKNILGLR